VSMGIVFGMLRAESRSLWHRMLESRGTVPHGFGVEMDRLRDRVAWITGSSRGIGAEIARVFASEGASVALHGRDRDALDRMAGEIESRGGRTTTVIGDVTRSEEIEAMRGRVESALGPIDILVANAGGSFTPPSTFEMIPEDGWRRTIDGNLTATFLTIRAVLPGMKQRTRGNVVTISSAAARRPHPQSPVAYAAAKAGIQMLTQHLASQVGSFGIRVNCIAPETILTEANLERIPADMQARMAEAHAIRRLGTPKDVARTALFLASDESAWITGVVLDVAGGAVMHS
jgi:3-oxoacyl-[acyl-carrier protein] reductase